MERNTLFLWMLKTKALFQLALIYIPIMVIVFYLDFGLFSNWLFKEHLVNNSSISVFFWGMLWVYVQFLVFYFYHRCFIGIKKIFTKHKDFFLS